MRITSLIARAAAIVGLMLGAVASQAAEPRAGVDFDYLPSAMPTETPGKIEVIEFFWYGCPHCFHAEPAVEAWAKTLPKDVVFRREHAMFEGNTSWAPHAKLFVTLRNMGLVDSMTPKVFDAVHNQHIELRDEDVLFDWIAKQGINRAQFEAIYKSFGIQAGMNRQIELSRMYHIDGVPTFIVNGKYVTSPGKMQVSDEVASAQKMVGVINALIAKERASVKPAKAAGKPAAKAAKAG